MQFLFDEHIQILVLKVIIFFFLKILLTYKSRIISCIQCSDLYVFIHENNLQVKKTMYYLLNTTIKRY